MNVLARGGSWKVVVACGGSCVVLETTHKKCARFDVGWVISNIKINLLLFQVNLLMSHNRVW